jgi:C1A family cysteine protease
MVRSPDAHGFCNPVPNQQVLGGHAVVCVGYFRLKNKWWAIVRNSWGLGLLSWGDYSGLLLHAAPLDLRLLER